jgi:hypothetical protein
VTSEICGYDAGSEPLFHVKPGSSLRPAESQPVQDPLPAQDVAPPIGHTLLQGVEHPSG